jgi:hypothetical protein
MTEEEFRFQDVRSPIYTFCYEMDTPFVGHAQQYRLEELATTHGVCEATMQLRLDEMLPR